MIRVIGIDPGTNVLGVGILDYEDMGFRLADVRMPYQARKKTGSISTKLQSIYDYVHFLIGKYECNVLAVETQFIDKNPQGSLRLAQATGAIIAAAGFYGLEVFEYAPASAKQAATGNGNATKETVNLMVRQQLGIKDDVPLDASDALSIAMAHCRYLKMQELKAR